MNKTLEQILRGAGSGAAATMDPIGTFINGLDYVISGAGIATNRSIPTVSSKAHRELFSDYKSALPFWKGYVARFGGQILGGLAATIPLYGAGTIGAVAAYSVGASAALGFALGALAIPVGTACYGIYQGVKKYFSSFVNGESINGRREKGSFKDGFRYGWHRGSYLNLFNFHYDLESSLTGRGIDSSHIASKMTASAGAMRRNGAAIAGSVCGRVVGVAASVASLGIVPLYKSIRDWIRTAKQEYYPARRPAYAY